MYIMIAFVDGALPGLTVAALIAAGRIEEDVPC